eukprot:TRINITY_DN822_c0_g1_i1.p2 TRINITY_DN822_c0_g1~~TRINITY_DN822_c0_g1_i1.p2  ORF type:complete len:311 (-),score=67.50 TRINITY_DN822_c0_g1_i1:126-1058(-)
MPPPLYLESLNKIVKDTLILKITNNKTSPDKQENVDVTLADFNQALWHIQCAPPTAGGPPSKKMTISCSCKCWAQLNKAGATPYLQKIYGPMLQATPETNFDVTLAIDLDNLPENGAANPEPLAIKIASLLRNMMAGPFHTIFDSLNAPTPPKSQLYDFQYRPNEAFWIKPERDRVICIFSICFDDPDDVVIGRVFLQEFGKLMSGAPSVDIHLKDPPLELQQIKGLKADGYVSFLLESRHMAPARRDQTINMLIQFRNYVHYHIKCSKAYLHIRMRLRVNLLLQVLNRAKQDKSDAAKRTASGRPFTKH